MRIARTFFLAALTLLLAEHAIGDETVLPYPEKKFQGKIERTIAESTPDFTQPVRAPKEAPNVLLILTV